MVEELKVIGESFKKLRINDFPFENFGIFWSDTKLAKKIFEGEDG